MSVIVGGGTANARMVTHADLDTLTLERASFPRVVPRGHRVAPGAAETRVVVDIFSDAYVGACVDVRVAK